MRKLIFYIVLIFIMLFPKLNIISVPNTYIGIRLEDFFILVFDLFLIYKIIHMKKNKYCSQSNLKKLSVLFIIFIMINFLSMILGLVNGYVKFPICVLYLLRKAEYFSFVFVGLSFAKYERDDKKIQILLNSVIIIHTILVIIQCLGGLNNILNFNFVLTPIRAASTFNGPYEFSSFLLLLVPIYIEKIKKEKKWINIIYVLMIFFGIYMSEARITLLVLIVIISLMILNNIKSIKIKFLIVVTTIIALLSIFYISKSDFKISEKLNRYTSLDLSNMVEVTKIAWHDTNFDEYLKNDNQYNFDEGILNYGSDRSYSIRIIKWTTLLHGVKNNMILGMGPSITGEAADGNYIRIISESGILGIILWLIIIFYLIFISKNGNNNYSSIVFYGAISLLLISFFIDIFEASKIMMIYWFIVGFNFKRMENAYE